jgi:hypothetical protein
MRKTAYTTLAVALVIIVGAIGCSRFKLKAEDEGPIIVKNGSMTIDTDGTNAAWQDDGGAWSNETGKDHRGDLWVRVDLTDGTMCRPTNPGHPVQIEYSISGFRPIFNVVGNPARTKVSPKGQLDRETNQRLRHGSGDGGYITGVRINGTPLSCDITRDNLKAINICSSPDTDACR